MPKLDKILATVAIIFCYPYEKLAVLKMFTRFLRFEQVKALKNV